jgi:divinyl chlorophyllide a 8-vinyl-reductase
MKVLLLGATGTIGQATAQALVQQGHEVVCLIRPKQGMASQDHVQLVSKSLAGTTLRWGDPCEPGSLMQNGFARDQFDAVISCMASRTGTPKDAWRVDYQAHLSALQAAQTVGVKHFILLSALCVQKPLLAFQHAKLAFEKALIESGMTYSIVRPTAFFKSLSGQLKRVKAGKPFLLFGDGTRTACKPISDEDLGEFIAGCLDHSERHNQILPIGGPGPAITPRQQGEALFQLLDKKPRFKSIPVGLMDCIIFTLKIIGKIIPSIADKAELARIGRYYATESMLVWDPVTRRYDPEATPSYGTQTLFDAYARWLNGEAAPDRGDHSVF